MSLSSGILASQTREFGIYDFPFMFANPQEADAVVDGAFGRSMHQKLEAKGIVGLAYWDLEFRNITNSRRPIVKLEDIAGLTLRVIPNAINVDWVEALGADPTPMPFPEVYTALEQKAIDGQENPVTVINANKFSEGDEKKILSDAASEAAKLQRKASRDAAGGALDNMKKNGMQVAELSLAELSGTTTLTAHLGYPTETFEAPMIDNPYCEQAGIDAVVVPMGVKAKEYPEFLKLLFELSNIAGALGTMPHKVTTVGLLDEVTPEALRAVAKIRYC